MSLNERQLFALDATEVLWEHARAEAERVLDLWEPPALVSEVIQNGVQDLRPKALEALLARELPNGAPRARVEAKAAARAYLEADVAWSAALEVIAAAQRAHAALGGRRLLSHRLFERAIELGVLAEVDQRFRARCLAQAGYGSALPEQFWWSKEQADRAQVWADAVQSGRAIDLPEFMDAAALGRVVPRTATRQNSEMVGALGALRQKLESIRRKPSAIEAPKKLTRAYMLYTFAYGHAFLGDEAESARLVEEACALLPAGDPIHRTLSGLYEARIMRARLPDPEPDRPAIELDPLLYKLDRLSLYKVERLMSLAPLLSPLELRDPFGGYYSGGGHAQVFQRMRTLPIQQVVQTDDVSTESMFSYLILRRPQHAEVIHGALDGALERTEDPQDRLQLVLVGLSMAGLIPSDCLERLLELVPETSAAVGEDELSGQLELLSRALVGLKRADKLDKAAPLFEPLERSDVIEPLPAVVCAGYRYGRGEGDALDDSITAAVVELESLSSQRARGFMPGMEVLARVLRLTPPSHCK